MQILWKVSVQLDDDFWHFDHNVKPFIWEDKLYYTFKVIDKMKKNDEGLYGIKIITKEIDLNTQNVETFEFYTSNHKDVLLPNSWKFFIQNSELFLFVGFVLHVKKQKVEKESSISFEEFKIVDKYDFKDRYITYNMASKLECFDKSLQKSLWKLKIKGYLYTKIGHIEDFIYFGSAGKSGAFYLVNIKNGEVICEFINGGASEFAWTGNSVILKDKKGNLTKINPFKNEILEILPLKNRLDDYATFVTYKDKIFTRVYNQKQNAIDILCLTCKG
ncbi:MAG: hypothetical protein ACK5LP_08445 [Campylobacteraceae bacterium]